MRAVIALILILFSSFSFSERYEFPPASDSEDDKIPGCDYQKDSETYQCNSGLILGNDDVIELGNNAPSPIIINVKGDVSFGDRVKVNEGGNARDLQLSIDGDFTVGDGASVAVTIQKADEVSIGDRTKDLGGISADEVELGSQAQVNGDINASSDVKIESQATVNGSVWTDGQFLIESQATVNGSVRANGQISIENQVKITGDVTSLKKIESDDDVEFGGNIKSDDSVKLGDRSEVAGYIVALDEVDVGKGSNIQGGITTLSSDGDIDIGNGAKVIGNISSSADFDAGSGTVFGGNITSSADFSAGSGAVFKGNINSSGEVDLGDRARVEGFVNADDDVQLGQQGYIKGNIKSGGDVDLGFLATAGSSVDADGDVSLAQQGKVEGDIKSGGEVDLGFLSGVKGSVDADDDVTLGEQGHINGSINSRGDVELKVRSIVEGYVNAKNGDDEGDLGEGTVLGLTCNLNNNYGPCDNVPPISLVHHYQLSYNSPALTCSGTNIDITACANEDCTEFYTNNSAVKLNSAAGKWTPNPVEFSVSGSTFLEQVNAGIYSLSVENASTTPQSQNPTRCIINGNLSESCNIEFSDTGFIFTRGDNFEDTDIPAQKSAQELGLRLQAVEMNKQTLACQAVTKPLSSVSMSMNCVDPDQCLMGALVNETEVTENSTSSIAVSFNEGQAPLEVNYKDAGAINLTAQATLPNGKTLKGTSEAFVWRPAKIGIKPIRIVNDDSESYLGGVFEKAGETFKVELRALNNDDEVTPNFGKETVPERLKLMAQTLDREAVRSPELNNVNNFSIVEGSVFANSEISYPEVGSPSVVAYIESEDYLPGYHLSPITLETESEIGRFIPYEFKLMRNDVVDGVSELKLYDGLGLFSECSMSENKFFYLNQEQRLNNDLRIIAVNKSGNITENYNADLAKGKVKFYPFNKEEDDLIELNYLRMDAYELEPKDNEGERVDIDWERGVGSLSSPDGAWPYVKYKRGTPGIEEGPYKNYTLGIQIDDQEGGEFYSKIETSDLTVSELNQNQFNVPAVFKTLDKARLLYGRFLLDNIFGAEVDDLPLTGRVEYWNGGGFVTNTDANCFNVAAANVNVISAVTPELADSPTEVSLVEGILPDPTLPLSELLRFSAYGSRTEFTFELGVPPYLQYEWDDDEDEEEYTDNPTAEGTFGIYRGRDRQIYWQEVGW